MQPVVVANAVEGFNFKITRDGAGLVTGTVDVGSIASPVDIGSIASPVDIGSVATTVDVNVASTSGPIETTPGDSSSSDQGYVVVDSTTGGIEILPARSRRHFEIFNTDASITVFLGFGTPPTTANGIPLLPGTSYRSSATAIPSTYINGITATGTANLRRLELF